MKLPIAIVLVLTDVVKASTAERFQTRPIRGSKGTRSVASDASHRKLGGKGSPKRASLSKKCGCSGCTETVWNTLAGEFTCGARIEYLQAAYADTYPTEANACRRVGETEFPDICGSCDPGTCGKPTTDGQGATYCGCPECTQGVWDLDAEDYSCGARITWLLKNDSANYPTEEDACRLVAGSQFRDTCGSKCNPDTCREPVRCGCPNCNDAALNVIADGFSCGERIEYVAVDVANYPTEVDACRQVAAIEFPNVCGPACNPNRCND